MWDLNWLKENWFKASIVLAFLIMALSALYYYVFFNPMEHGKYDLAQQMSKTQNSDLDMQIKCNLAAKKFFEDYFKGGDSKYAAQNSHWNKSLNKCFIDISDLSPASRISYNLFDALGGQEYGYIIYNLETSPSGENPGLCRLYPGGSGSADDPRGANCKSKTEFDNFVRPYMSN